ncbi:MAG: HAD-IIB family hydrolase [Desulfobacterota bacterium]|nr:HAD-IIB family hydrolase [Thermodesulfobacteriota bacterium]
MASIPASKSPQFIIFTDLDGTLLDHYCYSFDAAQEALKKINQYQIPLIICTSKTRAEIEIWRKKLKNHYPFISENGGAIFYPSAENFPHLYPIRKVDLYLGIELGLPHQVLLKNFEKLKKVWGGKIRGISEMDLTEVMELTSLPFEQALSAQKREYSEPFVFKGNSNEKKELKAFIRKLKLNLTEGDRFFHLMGQNDKGKAVSIVMEGYKRTYPNIKSIGIGDSFNDLPMLRKVDIPILVQKPNKIYDNKIPPLTRLIYAAGVGPRGWKKALLAILSQYMGK